MTPERKQYWVGWSAIVAAALMGISYAFDQSIGEPLRHMLQALGQSAATMQGMF